MGKISHGKYSPIYYIWSLDNFNAGAKCDVLSPGTNTMVEYVSGDKVSHV